MGVPTPGTLALVGAGEFLPPIAPVDAMLLERVDGTPHVVVLPTASAPDGPGVPERWAKLGIDHFPQLWRTIPALGIAPGIIVIPHFDEIPAAFTSTMTLAKRKLTLVGIDGSTALVRSDGAWSVYGRGGATVFNGNHKRRFASGEQVPLPGEANRAGR